MGGCASVVDRTSSIYPTHHNTVGIGNYTLDLILSSKTPQTSTFRIVLPIPNFGLPWLLHARKVEQVCFEPAQPTSNWHMKCIVRIDGKTLDMGTQLRYRRTATIVHNGVTRYLYDPNTLQVGEDDKCVRFSYDQARACVVPIHVQVDTKYLEDVLNVQAFVDTVSLLSKKYPQAEQQLEGVYNALLHAA